MQTPARAAKPLGPVYIWIATTFCVGLGLWVFAYWSAEGENARHRLLVSLGTSGLGLAFAGVLGGLVKKVFDDWDSRKQALNAQIAFYAQLLEDFKTVYNMVERSRFLISAHKSARTYGERLRDLPDAVILLHNVERATRQGFPDLYEDLQAPIFFCKAFLDDLITEFRDNYLRISRLQSQDEANNKYVRGQIALGKLPADSKISDKAWDQIKKLPHLKMLLDATHTDTHQPDTEDFKSYEARFLQYIDLASYSLTLRLPGNEAEARSTSMDQKLQDCVAAMQAVKAKP